MPLTASKLRENVYQILDSVLETGEAVEVVRKGRVLRIVADTPPSSRLARLKKRACIRGNPDDLVEIDWSKEWKPKALTYLDTHAAIWLYAGQVDSFSAAARAEIETADLRISPAVLLEIRLLQEIGRIEPGPDEILPVLQRDIGLTVCPIPFLEVVRAAYKESWTRDPFDRLIVSQAKAAKGKLVSKDRRIRSAYSRAVW